MSAPIEEGMFALAQLFLLPVLLAVLALFAHAFWSLGRFGWQAAQRRRGQAGGFELTAFARQRPDLGADALEAEALRRLEPVRLAARVAPMLGLVATMIPMGPALHALGEGQMAAVARSLTVAFSAVILALLAASITHCIAQVRRRWYADELAALARAEAAAPAAEPDAGPAPAEAAPSLASTLAQGAAA
ncbi:MotA/TolQ/ExbB proton channel family protein [Derxia gummosa]|uniref:MotA/TolQ/ExbB proton channel family protein n=1 Tax=Derxia gummosa DSM 723 TaxID=1121388 RepID=A0A8B6XAL8_9BURK|nr:MotA/TolQ/ExbB proton channel family protein [Derxia gummosa]